MTKAEDYEEHLRKVNEILDQGWATARWNMWRNAIASILGGAAGFALIGTALYSLATGHPWDWASAGLRAGLWILFGSFIWGALMVWEYRTNPLRRR